MKDEQYPDGQEWVEYKGYFICKDGGLLNIVVGMPGERNSTLLDNVGIEDGLPAAKRYIDGFEKGCHYGAEQRMKLIRKALGL